MNRLQRLLKAAQVKKIDRVAAAYAVVGWLLVQAADIALPTFDAPAWALRAFIVAVIAGFPIALVIAWLMAPKPPSKAMAAAAATRADMALLALLALVLVVSVAQVAIAIWRGEIPSPAASAPAQASIAVLPFVNMSGDPDKEYFSDGISEQLLNDLSNQPDLRVASRTSSFAFKGRNEDIQEIARLLNVSAILEGSVREDGNRVRITAQLINAADGYHLWSQTYDRELTDILALQDEIARAIVGALTHKLLGTAEPSPGKPAQIDPDAYRKYLEGQFHLASRTNEGIARAVELFKQVIVLQPDFADGYAALSRTYIAGSPTPEREAQEPLAEAAAAEALRLDPGNLDALFTRLALAGRNWDWETLDATMRRMRAINPNHTTVQFGLYWYYSTLGFHEQAVEILRRAADLDPLSIVLKINLASDLILEDRFAESLAVADALLALQPGHPMAIYGRCWALTELKRLDEARAAHDKLTALAAGPAWLAKDCTYMIAIRSGRMDEARAITDEFAASFPNSVADPAMIGYRYVELGDFDKAMGWLERAYDEKDAGLFFVEQDKSAQAAALRETPRWQALWRRPLIRQWQDAHDRLAAELAAGN